MDNNRVARQITSLLDFANEKPKSVMLEVEFGDDLIALEIEVLSHAEWMGLDHATPYPDRVSNGMTPSGPVYDYSHPEYQRSLRERVTRVQLKRMARCITAEIPGDTNDAQADWLDANYPIGFLTAIASQLNTLHSEGEASIRRGNFQQNGRSTVTGDGDSSIDS